MAGVRPAKPVIVTALSWLTGQQNPDSGWSAAGGGLAGSRGDARSGAPATAVAIAALLAASPDGGGAAGMADAVRRGAAWLVRVQLADGGWPDKPGGRSGPRRRPTLVPGLVLPLSALGRYVHALAAADLADATAAESVRIGVRPGESAEPVPAAGD
jgi:hypothetical protein